MSTIELPTPTKLTAADLLAMSDEKDLELIDGQLETKNVGFDSCWIAMNLVGFLVPYCRQMKLGWVLGPDAGYQCFPDDPQKVRKPDVSFISLQKLQPEHSPMGFIPIAPDLAVEVVSPNDSVEEVDNKVDEYLSAGVRLVWVIIPATGKVQVHNSAGGQVLLSQDELSGEDVIPGFKLKIADLLRKPGE